jgi:hypothetical protein
MLVVVRVWCLKVELLYTSDRRSLTMRAFVLLHVCTAVGRKFFKVQVVGDFPEADAREFFRTCLQQQQPEGAEQLPPLLDADWAQVYEVRCTSIGWFGQGCLYDACSDVCPPSPLPSPPTLSPTGRQVQHISNICTLPQ